MKNITDAFTRTLLATILYEIISWPFIKVGTGNIRGEIFSILMFLVPVFVAMVIINFMKDRATKKSEIQSK